MPFFFDLSSALPTVERNPFEPVVVADEVPLVPITQEVPAEPIIDTGLPIPSHYNIDLMRVFLQDPFHLFVHWQLRNNPYERLRRIFAEPEISTFHTVLKLIDETNNIAVYFDAAFAREYWFSVFPDRIYRVELGLRSHKHGYIKLLSSQSVQTPRGTVSEEAAPEPEYQVSAEEYLQVLRESHLVPERAFTVEGLLPLRAESEQARAAFWDSLPSSVRRLLTVIADIQAGREYERVWERLGQEELKEMVREFLTTLSHLGDGELGYMLLLRYLPELMRRALAAEGVIEVDKPLSLYLAEQLGQMASEINLVPSSEASAAPGEWLPSLNT